jgi:hypothetical protein
LRFERGEVTGGVRQNIAYSPPADTLSKGRRLPSPPAPITIANAGSTVKVSGSRVATTPFGAAEPRQHADEIAEHQPDHYQGKRFHVSRTAEPWRGLKEHVELSTAAARQSTGGRRGGCRKKGRERPASASVRAIEFGCRSMTAGNRRRWDMPRKMSCR